MNEFPSNSRRPVRSREEPPKVVNRVVESEVVRRKTPIGRRMSQSLIGGDTQSVWAYIFGEVLIPSARDMIADAVSGGVERMIFGDASSTSSRRRGGRGGPVSYDRYSKSGSNKRDDGRRELSHRARATHSFDEIILNSRVEAEEVLDHLESMIDKYEEVSVADLYGLVGVTSQYTDQKYGWTDLRAASIQRVRNGYLLNLPKAEQI